MSRQRAHERATAPDGTVTERTTTANAWVLWDAAQSIEKTRVSNGKTQTIGVTGSEQRVSSSNTVELIRAAGEGIAAGIVKGVAP